MSDILHVFPLGDLIEHDLEHDDECVCGPATEPVANAEGVITWLLVHHALDGREFHEAPR